jgi:hypothetical protein
MSDLEERIRIHAAELALALCPDARREGAAVWLDDSTKVYVAGLKRGMAEEITGDRFPFLALVEQRMGLEWEEAEMWCEVQLSNIEEEKNRAESVTEGTYPTTGKVGQVFGKVSPGSEDRAMDNGPAGEPEEIQPPQAKAAQPSGANLRANGSHGPEHHRLLPQAPEVEKSFLGAFMVDPANVGLFCTQKGIFAGHFHLPAHTRIFDEMLFLYGERIEFDLVTLTQHLRDAGRLDEAGGAGYVTEVYTCGGLPVMCEYYADTLRQKYALRESIRVHTELAERAYSEQDQVWDLIEEGKKKTERLAELAAGKVQYDLPPPKGAAQWNLAENLMPDPPQVLHGILHQTCKMMLAGPSKARKTFVLADLAVSVAAGVPWMGIPTTQGRVLFINFEVPDWAMQKRLNRIATAKDVALQDSLQVLNLRGAVDPMADLSEKILPYCRRHGPFAAVIVDPYYKLSGGKDEIGTAEVMRILNLLEKVASDTGAAIAYSHHFSKGDQSSKTSMDRASGSGAFGRDPDAILTMTEHDNEDSFTIESTLRLFKRPPAFVIKWEEPIFVIDEAADPTALKQVGRPFEAKYSEQMLLDKLSVIDGISVTALCKAVMEEHGMTKATFYNYLRPLREMDKHKNPARVVTRNGLLYLAGRAR